MFLKIGCLEISLLREGQDMETLGGNGNWDILKVFWRYEFPCGD